MQFAALTRAQQEHHGRPTGFPGQNPPVAGLQGQANLQAMQQMNAGGGGPNQVEAIQSHNQNNLLALAAQRLRSDTVGGTSQSQSQQQFEAIMQRQQMQQQQQVQAAQAANMLQQQQQQMQSQQQSQQQQLLAQQQQGVQQQQSMQQQLGFNPMNQQGQQQPQQPQPPQQLPGQNGPLVEKLNSLTNEQLRAEMQGVYQKLEETKKQQAQLTNLLQQRGAAEGSTINPMVAAKLNMFQTGIQNLSNMLIEMSKVMRAKQAQAQAQAQAGGSGGNAGGEGGGMGQALNAGGMGGNQGSPAPGLGGMGNMAAMMKNGQAGIQGQDVG